MFNFVNPQAVLISNADPLKKIELAGRTCYKSEDKITDTSAKKFVRRLMDSHHTAMVEHAVVVFDVTGYVEKYHLPFTAQNPYLRTTSRPGRKLVSGNVRAINEFEDFATKLLQQELFNEFPDLVYDEELMYNKISGIQLVDLDSLPGLTLEEIEAHKALTLRLTTDRGVTHELVRHRPCSFAQESTRYVNYKEGISVALPAGFYERPVEVQEEYQKAFEDANRHYARLIELGQKPQEARAVLPTATKTEIVVTANVAEWNHIFNLRLFGTTGAPHPDIKALMEIAYEEAGKDPLVAQYREMTAEK